MAGRLIMRRPPGAFRGHRTPFIGEFRGGDIIQNEDFQKRKILSFPRGLLRRPLFPAVASGSAILGEFSEGVA